MDLGTIDGDGGSVTLYAGQVDTVDGKLSIIGNINADGGGSAGYGGNISMQAPHIDFAGTTVQHFSADGSGDGAGGYVSFTSTYGYSISKGSPLISANGGYIELIATDPAANISIGNSGTGDIRLSATGGSLNSSAGDGGTIHVRAGGDLTVRPQNVNVASKGSQGAGGTIQLFAGFQGSSYEFNGSDWVETFQFNDKGTLTTLSGGTLNASADGAGNGGSIDLQAPNVNIGSSLNVNAGANGTGGNIHIESHAGSGSALLVGTALTPVAILANGGTLSGAGGTIELKSSTGIELITTSTAASARGTGDGGNVTIQSSPAGTAGGAINIHGDIYADADGDGTGGNITIKAEGAGASIDISPATSGLFARGGITSGAGGKIQLESGGTMTLEGNTVNASARGSGDGGSIGLASSSSGSDSMILSGTLRADAAGSGKGGIIALESAGYISSAGVLSMQALGGTTAGDGGAINVSASSVVLSTGDLNASARAVGDGGSILLEAQQDVSADSRFLALGGLVSGAGGTIALSASNISLGEDGINASSRAGAGDGGTITLNASGNLIVGGNLDVRANSDIGNGGRIILNAHGDLLDVSGKINFSAYGDGDGGLLSMDEPRATRIGDSIIGIGRNGGTYELTAPHSNLDLDTINLQGLLGRGGRLNLQSNEGDIKFFSINVNGFTQGGSVALKSEGAIVGKTVLGIGGNITARGGTFQGGDVLLQAKGNISTGSIDVGSLASAPGQIHIMSNTSETGVMPFTIGSRSDNGATSLLANGVLRRPHEFGGAIQSFIVVSDFGQGGITLTAPGKIQAKISNDSGIPIVLNSPNGTLTLTSGLKNDATSKDFSAGTLLLFAKNIELGGNISASNPNGSAAESMLISSSSIHASKSVSIASNGYWRGGHVLLVGAGNQYLDESDPKIIRVQTGSPASLSMSGSNISISANSVGTTSDPLLTNHAGSVSIIATDLSLLSQVTISASGTNALTDCEGGRVSINAVNNLIVSKHLSILANATGSGSTDEVYLSAGNDLSFGTGANDISVSFVGGRPPELVGDTGTATLKSTSGSIAINQNGLILTSSFEHIGADLQVLAAKNVSFGTGTTVSVDGGTGAYAGQIRLEATNGSIVLNDARLSANDGYSGQSRPSDFGTISLAAGHDISTNQSNAGTSTKAAYIVAEKLSVSIGSGSVGDTTPDHHQVTYLETSVSTLTFTNTADNKSINIHNDRSLVVNDSGSFGDVDLKVDGQISQSSASDLIHLTGANKVLLLQATNDIVGVNDKSMEVNTPLLFVSSTTGKIDVHNDAGGLSLQLIDGITANSSIKISTTGDLSIGNFESRTSSVDLSSSKDSGALIVVRENSVVAAGNGSIKIHLDNVSFATNGNPSTIALGKGSKLLAPNVAVFIAVQESQLSTTGNNISFFQVGTLNDNVTYSGPGDIRITDPSNWILQTDNGNKNFLSASSGNIYLESGDPSSSINLFGNVFIGIAFQSNSDKEQRIETDRKIAWLNPATGEQTIYAKKSLSLAAGGVLINIAPHTLMQILRTNEKLVIRNLTDTNRNALRAVVDTFDVLLHPSEQITIFDKPPNLVAELPIRRPCNYQSKKHFVSQAEFSLPYLISQDPVIRKLRQSEDPKDQQLIREIIKTTAALITLRKTAEPFLMEKQNSRRGSI